MVADEGTKVEFADVAADLRALWDWTVQAVREGTAAHEVERHLFRSLLELGAKLLRAFFEQQGDGDLGETFPLPDGRTVRRLPEPHVRRYVSVFGELLLSRRVYGRREGQAIEFVPFDQRLSLPESRFSYLVQEWDQLLGIEHAFGRVLDMMHTILAAC